MTMNRTIAAVAVFAGVFVALSRAGTPADPAGALLASGALGTLTLCLFAASARRSRTEAMGRARGLALTDAEGLMRMDTDKG